MMTRIRCGTIALVFLGLASAAIARQSEWSEFTSNEGKFTVSFPGKPNEGKQSVQTAAGALTLNTFSANVAQPKCYYVVIYTDYPPNTLKKTDDDILNGARDGALKNSNGKLLSEKKITLDKYAGREFFIEIPSGENVRCRVYIVNSRLYQNLIIGAEETVKSKDAEKFVGSFKLTK